VVAIAATIGVARPELMAAPQNAVMPRLLPLLPTLAVAGLSVYALCAILLTAGALIASSLRLRRHVDRDALQDSAAFRAATFHDTTFHESRVEIDTADLRPSPLQLPPPLAAAQQRPPRTAGVIDLHSGFRPEQIRSELSRLFYVWAARTHFFSTLILLTAAVALGEAQQHASLPIMPGPIPTAAALLAVAGLVLVALLARIAVDITIEPLAEAVTPPATDPRATDAPASDLLRRAVDLLETAKATPATANAGVPAIALQMPDRLIALLEEGQRALLESVERLSATTEKTAAATRSSIESLEATLRSAEPNPQAPPGAAADVAGLAELREAVTALTAVLERVLNGSGGSGERAAAGPGSPQPGSPQPGSPQPGSPQPGSPRQGREPDLANELKKLLREIETAP
jgi:hypothetical protein